MNSHIKQNIPAALEKLVKRIKLGSLYQPPSTVNGGALHTMWRIKTSQGDFIAKRINPHIAEKTTFPESYEISEQIANLFKIHNVPAVAALAFNNRYVHEIDGNWFIIYPFVKGHMLDMKDINTEHGKVIGQLFAKIHNSALPSFDDLQVHYDVFDNDHWTRLINNSNHHALTTLLPQILKWNDLYQSLISELNNDLLVTHRDMHHKNILWEKDLTPHIVDWESAGLINPLLELIGYGCEWAGVIWGQFKQETFLALIDAYLKEKTTPSQTDIKTAFYGWIGHCVLGWTEFNIRRILGMISSDPNEINIGNTIIDTRMSKCLQYLHDNEIAMLEVIESSWNSR